MHMGARDISARLRTGAQMRIKLASITLRTKRTSKVNLFLSYLLTQDFLGGCF